MKKKYIIITIAVAVLIAIGFGAKSYFSNNLDKLSSTPVGEIDFSKLTAGTYTGKYSSFPIEVQVEIQITDHKLTNIKLLKHVNGEGKPAEVLVKTVVEKQSLQVDSITGATYSSKVILKAIEDAAAKAE